jgi:hypothetical protein
MISASKLLKLIVISRFEGPKLRKILRICIRSFVNSHPGLNFINVLRTAFTHIDPECAKKDSQVSGVIWCFWDLRSVKAAHKMLVKLTPGVDSTKVLRAFFMHADPKSSKKLIT